LPPKITAIVGYKSLSLSFGCKTIGTESTMLFISSNGWDARGVKNLYCKSNLTIMENERYITWLKQDLDAWNQWRRVNSQRIDLVGVQLRGISLKRALLNAMNLSECDLKGADLKRAYLCNSSLVGANLEETDLDRASLMGADFRTANLTNASLKWACLSGADFRQANLTGADLTGADLTDADLTGADLTGANLLGADLTGALLVGIQARSTNFQGAILTGVCLEDWQIDKTTQLNELICDYIYLESGCKKRCPSTGSLALGEIALVLPSVLLEVGSRKSEVGS
jgi:uncharacterized protein YjbI with pentapeptide repeats